MKKLKNNAGFSLIEMLAAVAILVILVVGMESGLNAGTKAYSDSLFESNSGALSGILNTALGDILRYSEDIAVNPGLSGEVGAPEGFEDAHGSFIPPEKAGFAFTNYEYGVRAAYFEPRVTRDESPRIILALKNLDDTKEKELVNTGAYPNLEVDNFNANYDEEKGCFYITYDICDTEVEGRKRSVEYTVRLMNTEVGGGPASETVNPIPRPPHPGEEHGGDPDTPVNPGTNPEPHVCDFKKTDQVVAPTCTEKGYTVYKCECGKTKNMDFVKALGHDWDMEHGEVVEEATCKAEGTIQYKCKRPGCTDTKKKSIPKTDHKFGGWITTTQPTITTEGVQTQTCSICGKTNTRAVPKLTPDLSAYPEWKSGEGYVKDDIVQYKGKVYISIKGWFLDKNRGHRPTDTEYWKQCDFWDPEKVYNGGEIVIYGDKLYQAKYWTKNDEPGKTDPWRVY